MGKRKKLDPADINKILAKIRGLYNDYIIRFTKPLTLKERFELRYMQALSSSMDLEIFLTAEADVILTLIRREEDKIRQESDWEAESCARISMSEKADLIILEHKRKIAKYPDLPIHPDASSEIKKIFGALKLFDEYHWPVIDNALRIHSREFPARTRPLLQAKVTDLCTVRLGGTPLLLGKYQNLLHNYEHNIREIETEEKRLMLEASFFLHNLAEVHRTALAVEYMEDTLKEQVETSLNFVDNVIKDFRLTQLKPKTT